ncbi:asparagine--tRNA ligase [Candidatus Micrarchaeota archaeon]|nr:asparagine--tRNA ligase [Candidatus Micrarchaeota archaeon]
MQYSRISDAKPGERIALRGWVYRQRASKDIAFIVLRDSTGIIQCTVKNDKPFFKEAENLPIESSVTLEGMVKKDPRAPTGLEVEVDRLGVIQRAERFPITKDQSVEFLLDVRHLAVRMQRLQHVFKIRHSVFGAIHDYFRSQGFWETQSPSFSPTAGESGGELFEVAYFDKKAYLTQTWQLYAEAMIPVLERIYTIAPSFRSNKSRTVRHLTEYWHAEAEWAWGDLDDLARMESELVSHICQTVAKERVAELEALGRDPKQLSRIKPPFPRITYTEALELIKKDGVEVPWGKDLRTEEERTIAKHFDKPVIVSHYPKKIMAFYKPSDPDDPRVALCNDVICHETGEEIIGGSLRDPSIGEMKRALEEKGEKVDKYEWYFDTRRYGSVPHCGFGMGVERVVRWLAGLDNIRDAIPFPRTTDRFAP